MMQIGAFSRTYEVSDLRETYRRMLPMGSPIRSSTCPMRAFLRCRITSLMRLSE